jgi:hypothetical protein
MMRYPSPLAAVAILRLVSLLSLFSSPAGAANAAAVDAGAVQRIVDAEAAAARGAWPAVDLLSKLTAQSPRNGRFRLMLARARFALKDYAAAAGDYQAALALDAADRASLSYRIAQCFALQQDAGQALHWLEAAMALGYRELEAARTDPAFAWLRGRRQVSALLGIVDPSKMSRDDGWRYDIRFLAEWIEKKSYHPFRSNTADRQVSRAAYTRAEFAAIVAKLIADVPSLTDRQIEIALFRLVAALGDGHTEIEGSRTRIEFAMTLPLGFYVFDDGLYVISAAPKYRELLGAKVTALDGTPAASALRAIDELIAHDNEIWLRTMEPTFLRHVPFLKELGLVQDDAKVLLSVQTAAGKVADVRVDADPTAPDIWNQLPAPPGWAWIADGSGADYQRDNGSAFWWRWLPEERILYVQYNKVANGDKQSLADFALELGAAIDRYPVDKLVIDMRNNNGGDTHLNEPLLRAVAGASKVNRIGHLYVIIGRRTFSAAMNAVSYFARLTKAVFVGEPTGGKPNSPGDETFFTLPYSGIQVNLSDRYWQGSWPDDFSPWRAPDIAVPQTFADYAAGRDPAMAVIQAQAAPR